MDFILNTSRKIDNDQLKEFTFGDIKTLEEKLAVAFLNPQDLKKLNLNTNSNVKISSQTISIIVKAIENPNIPEGSILLPVSIWSNQLTRIEGGDIKYKNLVVNLERTKEPILSFNSLMSRIGGK